MLFFKDGLSYSNRTIQVKEFTIAPIQAPNDEIQYPYARFKPDTIEYALMTISDLYTARTNGTKNIEFAKKRLSELKKWGEQIPIDRSAGHSTNPDQTYSIVMLSWKEKMTTWWKYTPTELFNSWESELGRYASNYEAFLINGNPSTIEEITRKSIAKREIQSDKNFLANIIQSASLPKEDKFYLSKISQELFTALLNKIQTDQSQSNSTMLFYPLLTNGNSLPQGNYDVLADTRGMPKTNLTLGNNGDLVTGNPLEGNPDIIKFSSVKIDPNKARILTLRYDYDEPINLPLIPTTDLTLLSGKYLFKPGVMDQELDHTILVHLQGASYSAISLFKKSLYINSAQNRLEPFQKNVVNALMVPIVSESNFEQNLRVADERLQEIEVRVNAEPVNNDNPVTAKVSINPNYLPKIYLTLKHSNQSVLPQSKEDGLWKWLLLFLLNIFLASLILVKTQKAQGNISTLMSNLARSLSSWEKYSPPIFYLFFISFVVDVFVLRLRSDLILLLGVILYVISQYLSRTKSDFTIHSSAFLILGSLLMNILKFTVYADRLASWAYIFLFISIIYKVIEARVETLISERQFFIQMLAPLASLVILPKNLVSALIIRLKNRVKSLKNQPLKNKVLFLVLFVLALFYFLQGYQQLVQDMQFRESQTKELRISEIQPKLVYPSINFILKGSNFGINTDRNARVMSSDGEWETSWWTNEKIMLTIPITKKPGIYQLWIEKVSTSDQKKSTIRSNKVSIRILSRTDGWDELDDEYFKQLNKMDRELLKVNGYVR